MMSEIPDKNAGHHGDDLTAMNGRFSDGTGGDSNEGSALFEADRFMRSVTRWKIFLRESGEDIYSVIKDAEKGFLDIGKHLHDFQSLSTRISEVSSHVAGLISGDDLLKVMGGLNAVLERLNSYHAQFAEGIHLYTEKLNDLLEHIKKVNEHVADLRSIAKNLQFLSLATKIQSAVTGTVASGFNVLALNVKSLTLNVIKKTDAIARGVRTLRDKVTSTLASVTKIEVRERKQTEEILGKAMEIMRTLEKKRASSSDFLQGIMFRSGEVSRRIEKVVMSMQFHDITRQKIEHVKKAINYLLEKDWTADKQGPEEEAGSGTIGLPEVVQVSALQSSQMKTARNELKTAVENILRSLLDIGGSVSDLMRETRTLTKAEQGVSFVENMDNGISTVSKTFSRLSENVSAAQELSAAMDMFMALIQEMSSFTRDMEQIESEIEVLALNAGIRAGQIGEKGTGLGKIAMNIQALSGKTHIPTSEISSSVRAIESVAEDISSYLTAEEYDREELLKGALEELKTLHGSFESINQRIRNDLLEMEHKGQRLTWDIERVVDGVTVHEVTAGVLTRASDGIDRTINNIVQEMPEYNVGNIEEILKEISELYTMQSERDIHKAYAQSGELRGNTQKGLQHFERDDDMYDDNIELFS